MKPSALLRAGLIMGFIGIIGPTIVWAQGGVTQKVGNVTLAVEGSLGGMFGNVTYRIGGLTQYQSGESTTYHYPISKLEFPLNNVMARLGLSADLGRFGATATFSKNLTTAAGTMKDSDWSDTSSPSTKTIFSESDSELDALIANVGLNMYFMKARGPYRSTLSGTLGFLYEDFYWENSNFDQSYPSTPWLAHDYYSGGGITYETTLMMPYIGLTEQISVKNLDLSDSFNFAPWARIEDEDDHTYRNIRANMTADGMATQCALQGVLNLTPEIYLFMRGEVLVYWADGTSENYVYGVGVNNSSVDSVGETWTIEEDIGSTQFTALAGVGFKL